MEQRRSVRTRVHRFTAAGLLKAGPDKLAGEEPLEIRIDGTPYAVTMRTPGEDVELIFGFLLAEAIITNPHHVTSIDFSTGLAADGTRNYNVARVTLRPGLWDPHRASGRNTYTSSSCGICGTAAIEEVTRTSAFPLTPPAAEAGSGCVPLISPTAVLELPDRLRQAQKLFDATGGVHAAALFHMRPRGDVSPDREATPAAQMRPRGDAETAGEVPAAGDVSPELLVVREDVGRHNAVDKVIGWALQNNRLPLHECVLQVSARASFELVQKAAMAGIPLLSAVSAPSSLAVEYGKSAGVTVVAFNRGKTFNAYTHIDRIG